MAILDGEDKQALRELAFGATEKIKDKVWRAILMIGLVIFIVLGVIALVRLHSFIIDPWLLGGIFAVGVGLIILILSLKIFNGYHAQLRKILLPVTILCCVYLAFALTAPVYQEKYMLDVGDTTQYAGPYTANRSFIGSPSF